MKNRRLIDHIRILAIMPCVYIIYQIVANIDVELITLLCKFISRSFFNVWRYISEMIICIACLCVGYFVAPKSIKTITSGIIFLFYIFNFSLYFILPVDVDNIERTRNYNIYLSCTSAAIAYICMVSFYEKRKT